MDVSSPLKKKKSYLTHTTLMTGSLWSSNDDTSLCALPAVTSDDVSNDASLYVLSSVTSESASNNASLYVFPRSDVKWREQ